VISAAEHAFVSGVHVAAVIGALLTASAALMVWRFLPRQIDQHGAARGPIDAAENAAELGLGGVPPIFADTTR
jgi:hypothetical protein